MPQIKYSENATLDLVRLFNFLAEKNEDTAKRAIQEIRDSLEQLARMPKIGRPVEHGLRELVIDFGMSGYLALYDFDEMLDEVQVFALRHQLEKDYK